MNSFYRRENNFVKELLGGKNAQLFEGDIYKVNSVKKSIGLPIKQVKLLLSAGVISFRGNEIVANAQSKNWLKRRMLESENKFLAQHQNIETGIDGEKRNINEGVLSRLAFASRGNAPYLMPHQLEAGRRFSSLYEKANLRARVSMSYGAFGGGGNKAGFIKSDISDMAIDARNEINRILQEIPKDCSSVIIDVLGEEKGLQMIESERGWPRRSAKLVLRIGLEQLAIIFGLCEKAIGAYRA